MDLVIILLLVGLIVGLLVTLDRILGSDEHKPTNDIVAPVASEPNSQNPINEAFQDNPRIMVDLTLPDGVTAPSSVTKSIVRLNELDSNFTPKSFIQNSQLAYEWLIENFNNHNEQDIQKLLSPQLSRSFIKQMQTYKQSGQSVKITLKSCLPVELSAIRFSPESSPTTAWVEVLFDIEQETQTSTTSPESQPAAPIEPAQTLYLRESLVFEKDLNSTSPAWVIAEIHHTKK